MTRKQISKRLEKAYKLLKEIDDTRPEDYAIDDQFWGDISTAMGSIIEAEGCVGDLK